MKNTLAQLFITGVGVAFIACLATFAFAGLYVGAKWVYELFTGWRTHVAPTRQAHAARLIDAEAEGWLDEWSFPRREPLGASAPDQTGEMELPRVAVA